MSIEEQVREKLKTIGTQNINLSIPAQYLERMVNWFDFCEIEGFSNDIDQEILSFLDLHITKSHY